MKKPRFKRNVFNVKKLKTWARNVKRRDGFKCLACGYKGYLHSHHILPKSKFKKFCYNIWNGVTLCKICHMSSNGVHGTGKARNKIVSSLRRLLIKGDKSSVIKFIENLTGKKSTYAPYKIYKKSLKKYKRKLY